MKKKLFRQILNPLTGSSNLSGDKSNIYGDACNISGDVSNISGNVDECEISEEERKRGINIKDLVGDL